MGKERGGERKGKDEPKEGEGEGNGKRERVITDDAVIRCRHLKERL